MPRLHGGFLAGWVRSPVSCLCLCGCVGARKQRVVVDLNSSDLKQHLVRGQMCCLALGQGQAQSSLSLTCLPSFVMAFPFSAPSRGSCLCRAPAQQRARALHSSLLGNHTSPALWQLFLHFILTLGDQVASELWLGRTRCPFKPIGGCGFWGQRQQEGWSRCEHTGMSQQAGQEGGQSRLLWGCRLVQQLWQLPFPWRQQ